jgi:hypothetical protein
MLPIAELSSEWPIQAGVQPRPRMKASVYMRLTLPMLAARLKPWFIATSVSR